MTQATEQDDQAGLYPAAGGIGAGPGPADLPAVPGTRAARRPGVPLPRPVVRASGLMFAGAAANFATAVLWVSQDRSVARAMGFGGPVFGGGSAPATILLAIAATTIWAFLGYLNLECRPAARLIATYLFCLYSIPAGLVSLSVSHPSATTGAAVWVGLRAVAAAPGDVVLGLPGRGCGSQGVHAGGLADGIVGPAVFAPGNPDGRVGDAEGGQRGEQGRQVRVVDVRVAKGRQEMPVARHEGRVRSWGSSARARTCTAMRCLAG